MKPMVFCACWVSDCTVKEWCGVTRGRHGRDPVGGDKCHLFLRAFTTLNCPQYRWPSSVHCIITRQLKNNVSFDVYLTPRVGREDKRQNLRRNSSIYALESWAPTHRLQPWRPGILPLAAVTQQTEKWEVINLLIHFPPLSSLTPTFRLNVSCWHVSDEPNKPLSLRSFISKRVTVTLRYHQK